MQNQIRTNEIRIDLLRKQNESLKTSLEKLLLAQQNQHSQSQVSMINEERYEELRNQSRQESMRYRRFSSGNDSTSVKTRPTPLWALSDEILENEKHEQPR